MTPEERAELLLLLHRSDDRFVIKVTGLPAPDIQRALERAQDSNWVTLIDVEDHNLNRPVARVFRLTEQGHYRLRCLQQLRDNELGEQ